MFQKKIKMEGGKIMWFMCEMAHMGGAIFYTQGVMIWNWRVEIRKKLNAPLTIRKNLSNPILKNHCGWEFGIVTDNLEFRKRKICRKVEVVGGWWCYFDVYD